MSRRTKVNSHSPVNTNQVREEELPKTKRTKPIQMHSAMKFQREKKVMSVLLLWHTTIKPFSRKEWTERMVCVTILIWAIDHGENCLPGTEQNESMTTLILASWTRKDHLEASVLLPQNVQLDQQSPKPRLQLHAVALHPQEEQAAHDVKH